MTPALRSVMATPDAQTDPLVRSARADVARLSLQVRTAQDEFDRAQQRPLVDRTSARELLQTSLDEVVLARRRELSRVLDEERRAAERVVAEAHEEAAAIVAAALAARVQNDEHAAGAAAVATAPSDPGAPASAIDPPTPAVPMIKPPPPSAVPPPEYLAQVVQAAVTATLAQVGVAALAGGMRPAPQGRASVVANRPSFRRRLLHLDVLLPLIAVLLVFLVLLAWVG